MKGFAGPAACGLRRTPAPLCQARKAPDKDGGLLGLPERAPGAARGGLGPRAERNASQGWRIAAAPGWRREPGREPPSRWGPARPRPLPHSKSGAAPIGGRSPAVSPEGLQGPRRDGWLAPAATVARPCPGRGGAARGASETARRSFLFPLRRGAGCHPSPHSRSGAHRRGCGLRGRFWRGPAGGRPRVGRVGAHGRAAVGRYDHYRITSAALFARACRSQQPGSSRGHFQRADSNRCRAAEHVHRVVTCVSPAAFLEASNPGRAESYHQLPRCQTNGPASGQ